MMPHVFVKMYPIGSTIERAKPAQAIARDVLEIIGVGTLSRPGDVASK